MTLCVVIPAYEPGRALLDLVAALSRADAARIVIVNDGSGVGHEGVFAAAEQVPGVTVLNHAVNLGKGAALKTGLNHCLYEHGPDAVVVTADADGQHAPEDVLAVGRAAALSRDALVLGARRFDGGRVPLRSRIGNVLTRHVLRAAVGCRLTDTQTGLRAVPARMIPKLLRLPASGYEFELDMLLLARQMGVRLEEVPIRTLYLDGNASSHFDPFLDSMRVYFVLLRFTLASLATAGIDYTVFAAAFSATESISRSQIAARAVAVLFNYAAVKRLVFYSDQRHRAVFPRYLALVVFSGLLSYAMIRLIDEHLPINVFGAKLVAESLIFIMNFAVMREFIFRGKSPPVAGAP